MHGKLAASETTSLPELRIDVPNDLFEKIEAQKPNYLDRKGFICLILDSALDRSVTIPAYRVGAGERVREPQKLPLQFPPQLEVTTPEAQQAAVQAVSDTLSTPLMGREFEKGGTGGKEKKGETNLKPIPENLMQHETLIREFWTCKKGSRNSRAWSLLLTELQKIQDKFGSDRAQEQLTLAINGLWKGVTMSNMQRFEPPKKPWQQEPEMKHPAHRDFTAERIAAEQEGNENFLGF